MAWIRLHTIIRTPVCSAVMGTALLSAALGISTAQPLQANPTEAPFPTMDQLREIQLAALDCGRENTSSSCDKARNLADPLMDHPRLSAGCKDSVWSIVQQAKVATANTYERRETLNKAGAELLVFCKRQTSSVLGSSEDAKGNKKSRFGLIQNQTP